MKKYTYLTILFCLLLVNNVSGQQMDSINIRVAEGNGNFSETTSSIKDTIPIITQGVAQTINTKLLKQHDNRNHQLLPIMMNSKPNKGEVNSLANQPYFVTNILEKSLKVSLNNDNDKKFIKENTGIDGGSTRGWNSIMSEDFEGTFPAGLWSAYAVGGYTDAYWDDASCRAHGESWSGYCADRGTQSVSCGDDYQNDMKTFMRYGPFDLSDANDAYLDFYWWANTESGFDYFKVMASIDGTNFSGVQWSGDNSSWNQYTFDLTDVGSLGNLCGYSQVWITFGFQSDVSITRPEGAYVDDIVLWKNIASGTQDLELTGGSFSPNPIIEDGSLYIDAQFTNNGDGATSSSEIQYYLSTNTIISPSDCLLGNGYVTLNPGQTGNDTITVHMSGISCVSPGTYYLGVYSVDESDAWYWSTPLVINSSPPLEYTITISSNPANGGTTSGGGSYEDGSQCCVTAAEYSGFTFSHWEENGSNVSSSSPYCFTVTGNRNLVAIFNPVVNYFTITTSSSPSNGGTTNGGGTIEEGTQCCVTAAEYSGFTFSHWEENGSSVSSSTPYCFNVSGDRNLVAIFIGQSSTIIQFQPSSQTVSTNTSFTTDIKIIDVQNLGGFELEINYDPTLLQATSITLSAFLESTVRTSFELSNNIDNSTGLIEYAIATLGATPAGANGNGVLITIEWQSTSTLGTTDLELQNVQVTRANASATLIQTTLENGTVTIAPSDNHFTPIWTGYPYQPMSILLSSATIDATDLSVGDEIGIFDVDGSGNEICVGVGLVNQTITSGTPLTITASTDDPNTTEVDGFTTGNTINYKAWSTAAQEEYSNYEATYNQALDMLFTPLGTSLADVEFLTTVTQTIVLNEGWNMMSFYVEPDDMNMVSIVQPIITSGELLKVIDEAGGFIQDIPGVGWMNTIGDMANTEGYYIKVSNNCTLEVTGMPVVLPFDIPLNDGWNIMGYPKEQSQEGLSVVQVLIDAGELIKVINEAGGFIQNIPGVGWMNTIGNFEPGEGYYIKVNANTSLTISSSRGALLAPDIPSPIPLKYFKQSFNNNPYSPMNVVVTDLLLDNIVLKAGDEIAVYDGELCVGAKVINEEPNLLLSIVVSADDPLTDIIDGFTEGNSLSFKYLSSDLLQPVDIYHEKVSGSELFKPLETLVCKLVLLPNGIDELPLETVDYKVRIYPNPAKNNTTIEIDNYVDGHVKIEVVNIHGKTIDVLNDASMAKGSYQLQYDVSIVPAGIYNIRLIHSSLNNSSVSNYKLIITK